MRAGETAHISQTDRYTDRDTDTHKVVQGKQGLGGGEVRKLQERRNLSSLLQNVDIFAPVDARSQAYESIGVPQCLRVRVCMRVASRNTHLFCPFVSLVNFTKPSESANKV